ncbi:hypothetical protein DRP53_02825 [candidate division WOR-3 bacterium]|uniref:4Fe-4S ferredoxin-type domain-containing protein n=1 Tax=candidate division WOR-3 bacterium TaxID=2052148 RepID=A0A660SJX2_UNCW3|nr:MAG: hypothetical protein DRP53_02825 [candidate division WOR-3 bacterium]
MKAFLCSCGNRIPLPEFKEEGVEVFYHDALCSPAGIEFITERWRDDEPIMIAGCSPVVGERYFSRFNPIYINIREQGSYLGHGQEKIGDLIRSGVAWLKATKPIEKKVFDVKSTDILIIGSGVAGLEAARLIGRKAILIERRPYLGGTVADLDRLYPEGTPNSHTLMPLINQVVSGGVRFKPDTEIVSIQGRPGDYRVRLRERKGKVVRCDECGRCLEVCPVEVVDHGIKRKAIFRSPSFPPGYLIDFSTCDLCGECVKVCPGEIILDRSWNEYELHCGGIIVATGLNHFDPVQLSEFGYGRLPNVYTHLEFERKLARGEIKPEKVVIVHCAGSRDERYLDYCSGICCLLGLKEAKLIKDRYPETEVYLLYIDIRVRGELEYLYKELRNLGVKFVGGRPAEIIPKDGRLMVKVEDSLSSTLLKIPADAVVLSTGFVPDKKIFDLLPINLDRERFPKAYDWSELSVDGPPHAILFAGSAREPMSVPDSILDARAKAYRLSHLLSLPRIESHHPVSVIDEERCSLCSLCIQNCPYGALQKEEKVRSDPAVCMGCGVCVATCPSGAANLESYETGGLMAAVESLTKEGTILAFLCRWSAYPAADQAYPIGYPESVRIIRVPCSGRVDPQLILKGFELGARAVLIGGCYPEACHYHTGNIKERRRIKLLHALDGIVDPRRLRIEWIGTDEAAKFVRVVEELEKA